MSHPASTRTAPLNAVAFIGLIGLITAISRPEFQAVRTVDWLQIFASGLALGAAIAGLLLRRRS